MQEAAPIDRQDIEEAAPVNMQPEEAAPIDRYANIRDATNTATQALVDHEVSAVAVNAARLAQELEQAAASAWLVWDAARDAVYAMPEFVEEEREDATMDVEETAERAYRRAQAAADDALVAAQRATEVLHNVEGI